MEGEISYKRVALAIGIAVMFFGGIGFLLSNDGTLFKGQLTFTNPDGTYTCQGTTFSAADLKNLPANQQEDCFKEIITTQLQNKSCDEIDADAKATIPSLLAVQEYRYLAQPIYDAYKAKGCTGGSFFSSYTDSELAKIGDYCPQGTYLFNKDNLKHLNGTDSTSTAQMCIPFNSTNSTFKAIIDSAQLSSCTNLAKISLNENNRFGLTSATKNELDAKIATDCACPGGFAYDKDSAGQCTYSCTKGKQAVQDAKNAYYLAIQSNSPTKLQALANLKATVEDAEKNQCYTSTETATICKEITPFKESTTITNEEKTTLDALTGSQVLGCCTNPGEELQTDGSCKVSASQLAKDFEFSVAVYELAKKQSSAQTGTKLQNVLAVSKSVSSNLELKTSNLKASSATCSSITTLLNSTSVADTDAAALLAAANTLQCCPSPGTLQAVNESVAGKKSYACAAKTTDMQTFVETEMKECAEVAEASVESISNMLIGDVRTSLKEKDSAKLKTNLDKVIAEVEKTTSTYNCKMNQANKAGTVTVWQNFNKILYGTPFDSVNYSPDALKSLDDLINESLNVCYYTFDKPSEKIDVYSAELSKDPMQLICKTPVATKKPELSSNTLIEPASATIDVAKGERIKFTYGLTEDGTATLSVLNQLGQQTLSKEDNLTKGAVVTTFWDAKLVEGFVPAGTYTYTILPKNSAGVGAKKMGTITVTNSGQGADNPTPPPTPNDDEDGNDTPTPPPSDDDDDDDDDAKQPSTSKPIKLEKVKTSPQSFNPLVNDTKISFSVTAPAIISVRVYNSKGQVVVTLVNDDEVKKGDHFVWWDGTDSNTGKGDVVEPGKYQYKVSASDPKTDQTKDTETGEINVVYAKTSSAGSGDFEDGGTVVATSVTTTTDNSGTSQNVIGQTNTQTQDQIYQANATMAMQNATTGTTSETGPGVLLYSLLPLAGYFLTRKK